MEYRVKSVRIQTAPNDPSLLITHSTESTPVISAMAEPSEPQPRDPVPTTSASNR